LYTANINVNVNIDTHFANEIHGIAPTRAMFINHECQQSECQSLILIV